MRLLHALLLLLAIASPAHARSGLGINLDAIAYWQSDWPFINELKRAAGWSTRCDPWATPTTCTDFAPGTSNNDTGEHDKVAWDENGYPRRLPAADDPTVKYRKVSALLFQGNGGTHAAGRYVVLYDGAGTLTYVGAGRRIDAESRPGRDVLEVTNTTGAGLTLSITRTDEANPLRNIRVIGPGGVCADAPKTWVTDAGRCAGSAYRSLEELSATQTFHPAYVGDLSGFRALRFAKWSAANTARVVRWRERPQPADPLWSGKAGVPFEAMFELARATGADPWISLPPFVDDDFARQFAQLARRSLAAGATLWFEYGNEPWNQAPPYSEAGTLYEAKAKAAWPGATLPAWQQRLNWYALRSIELCRIVKREFGADAGRVRCVAGSQAANPEVARTLLACELAQPALGAPCAKGFDALAIAPYFGFEIGRDPATVARWADEPDGGMGALFREVDRGLAQARSWIAANRQVADRFGLPLVAYEGGQHLQTYRGGKTEAMFRAANRDPRMGAAIRQLARDWRAAGGQLFTVFSYTQAARGGFWGMKEHQRDDGAPKWQAVERLRDEPCWWKGCER